MHMARSSGEQPRDVKRRYARRGGSMPPRAEQQEQSIFCNKHPRLKRYRPPERRTQGRQIHTHWRLGKTSKRSIIIGSKGLGNAHFFGQPERRQIKDVSQTACRRAKTAALMASMGGIARVKHPPYSSRFLPFLPFLYKHVFPFSNKIDAKHLARAPGSIPGLATILLSERRTLCSTT